MLHMPRRKFIALLATLAATVPFQALAKFHEKNTKPGDYPGTILILSQAFRYETIAHQSYVRYVKKALLEKYPNIAYMFHAFSFSEEIHAINFQRILAELGSTTQSIAEAIEIGNTKANLRISAKNELQKIENIYPAFLQKLETESCDDAIINCMYSWKSHRQHEKKVKEILRFSGLFFGSVANRIEGLNLDFHVCEICGSTIDKEPKSPCEICNMSKSHYKKIAKPV